MDRGRARKQRISLAILLQSSFLEEQGGKRRSGFIDCVLHPVVMKRTTLNPNLVRNVLSNRIKSRELKEILFK